MIRINDISLPLDYDESTLITLAAKAAGCRPSDIKGLKLVKRSVDARKKNNVHFGASVEFSAANEAKILKKLPKNKASAVSEQRYRIPECQYEMKRPVVVGFGPAGMFAALTLAQSGLKPLVLERGSDCDSRIKAIESFQNGRELDENSNVQFGEGGAGTFSDGKLTTGIKDIRIRHVFNTFVEHGAPKEILYLAKPHIGTDILRTVVKNIRKEIIRLGGEIIFNARFTDYTAEKGRVSSAIYEKDGKICEAGTDNIILAIGHSARDTFEMLNKKEVFMSQKSFAMGVRVEHLQSEVNKSLYGDFHNHPALSAADYKYVIHLPDSRALYTFCMCPGGYVVAAASEKNTVVTNGMSLFARDAENANSALLVNADPSDFGSDYVLAGMELQRKIEKTAFISGGSNYNAPVTLVGDFLKGNKSTAFGSVKPSYKPGTAFARPEEYLPAFICEALRAGIPLIGEKADFFKAGDAVLTGAETRSSSPVRINRNENLMSLSVKGLYPCGEGAGYAGGIVSAAVDGIKCSEAVIQNG
ncbi:MAG: hypothetical protein IJ416_07560 [Ruminiclostridium sp.]|nr:hypothetical protein [Ruminiclostridium sp.]